MTGLGGEDSVAWTKVDAVTPTRILDFRLSTRSRFSGENDAMSWRLTASKLAKKIGEPICWATSMPMRRSTASE